MSDLKNKKNNSSVQAYLSQIEEGQRAKDCRVIYQMMDDIMGQQGSMWSDAMVGFGSYHYKYESGREGGWFLTGFSNRKQSISIYIMSGFTRFDSLVSKLGKHKTSKSCLYIKKLADIDVAILKSL